MLVPPQGKSRASNKNNNADVLLNKRQVVDNVTLIQLKNSTRVRLWLRPQSTLCAWSGSYIITIAIRGFVRFPVSMDDELKGVVSGFGTVLEGEYHILLVSTTNTNGSHVAGLHVFLTASLSQEQLTAENDRSRRKFALQLGELLGKLKALGVLYSAPPRPGPKPGGVGGLSAVSIPGRRLLEPKPPVGRRNPSQQPKQPQTDEFYIDMNADQVQHAVEEEVYTDIDSNENQAIQEEFYTDMDPQAETQKIQDEFYTSMENEEATELEMYTDVDTVNGGTQLKIEESADSMDEDDHLMPGLSQQFNGQDSLRPPSVSSNSSDSPYAEFTGAKFKKVKASSLRSSSKAGYIEKLGGYRHNKWQKRYCILDDICLFFFTSDKDKTQNNQLLLIDYEVSANVTEIKEEKKFLFKIKPLAENVQLKTYFFRVPTEQLRDEWVNSVSQACGKGAGMSKRKTVFLQYHEQVGTPPRSRSVGPSPLPTEIYEDTNAMTGPGSVTISPSNTSDEADSDTAATPVTKRKPQPPPVMEESESKARGPPSLVPLTKRADPPVDTHRIYYHDKWFNYNDVFVAVWDCHADAANDLPLRRGDLVLVVNKVNADWWYATAQSEVDDNFKGKSGLVPSVYLDAAFEAVQ